ncbi:MAG: hypothetical protein RL235_46 [Chlamydiota bacterium]|jgi:hypothetical protein
MKSIASVITVCFFILLFSCAKTRETKGREYSKYVNEIVDDFAKCMKKKHNLHCYGSGGSMPHDVEEIELMFNHRGLLSIDDARALEVEAIQELLRRINAHEKIRPFLREYPFHSNRVGVLISTSTKTGDRPLDGSVALVFSAKNKIHYDAAEMQMTKPWVHVEMDESGGWTEETIPGELREVLIPLWEEPYDEAVKIVEAAIQKNGE